MSDLLAELRRIQDAPEPIAYIVLDPSRVLPPVEGRDSKGRRFFLCAASLLDALDRAPDPSPRDLPLAGLTGIPLYPRASLPEDWP